MRKLGIPPENLQPDRYNGPKSNLVPCVEAKRRPLTLDRQYPLLSQWRVSDLPTTGSEGEVWCLVKFESNGDAVWRRLDFSNTSPGLDTLTVDAITSPGVNPVEPNGVGNINLLADPVSAHSVPIETRTRALNELAVEVQVSSDRTGAPADMLDAGISSYDDSIFSVDANGYVSLVGGAVPPVQNTTVDRASGGAPNPVVPTGAGGITVSGNVVAAHNVAIESHTSSANTYGIDVQVASAVTGDPASKIDTGLSVYDDSDFAVTSDGYVTRTTSSRLLPHHVENLGISYSAGTFTIRGAQATLSTSNPAYISLPSKSNPGESVLYTITSDQSFIDDAGASEIINNLFGLPTGVAYSEDIPFFIYAVANDAEDAIQFMISRVTGKTTSPVTAQIGAPDDAVADQQYSFFSFDNIDETLYDENPCVMIGSFRMQMSSSDDWTVQALSQTDGIGLFQSDIEFVVPTGAFGAASGSHFRNNGGTAPQFNTELISYIVNQNSTVRFGIRQITCSSAGVGAVNVEIVAPFLGWDTSEVLSNSIANLVWGDASDVVKSVYGQMGPSDNVINFINVVTSSSGLQNASIALSDSFSGGWTYAMRLE